MRDGPEEPAWRLMQREEQARRRVIEDMEKMESIRKQQAKLAQVPETIARITRGLHELPALTSMPSMTNANWASEFYTRLRTLINDFNEALDQEYEVGVRLVNFGQAVVFSLDDMGWCNPSLLIFSGRTEDGSRVELIQHVSQISILLMKMKREHPETPKRKIGFAGEMECDDPEQSTNPG